MKLFIKISTISTIALLTSENGILSISSAIAMSNVNSQEVRILEETTTKTADVLPIQKDEIIEPGPQIPESDLKTSVNRPATSLASIRTNETISTIKTEIELQKSQSPCSSPRLKKKKQMKRFTYSEFMQHDFGESSTSPTIRSRRSSISSRPTSADTPPSLGQSSPPPAPSPLRTSSSQPFPLEMCDLTQSDNATKLYVPSITRISPPSAPIKSHSPAIDAIDEGNRIIKSLKQRGEYDRVFQNVNKWEWDQNKRDQKDPSFIQTRKASKKKSDD